MSVRRKGDRWEVRVRIGNGQRIERRLPAGATRVEAHELESQVRRDVVAASLGRFDHPIADALDRWQIDATRLRTWERDIRYRAQILRDAYGHLRVSALQSVADSIKKAGTEAGKSPFAINRYLAIVRRLGRLAVRWGWIERAPIIDLVPGERPRSVMLTPAEVRRLVAGADPRLGPMILFACLSGLRRGEQLALTPASIRDGHAIIPNSKTGRPRAVPLPPEAVKIATRCLPWGMTPNNAHRLFHEARAAAGLPHVRWHDLRRTYGSWMVAGGAPLHAVRDILGHGDIKTTSIYLATARKDLREAVSALPHMGEGRGKRARQKPDKKAA